MKQKTIWVVLALVLSLAMALSACQPAAAPAAPAAEKPADKPAAPAAEKPADKPADGKSAGILTFAMKEDVTNMDPLKANQYGDIRLSVLVAQQLVAPDRAGKFVGVLAEKWDTSADGKTWTFTLRKGVKFHNGQEMKSADVKWIFDRILDEKAGALQQKTFAGLGLKVEAVDDYTVKMTIEKGAGPFLSYLALLNRAAIIHKDSYAADGKVAKMIGTGPFMMTESKPGDSYTLAKFPEYWKSGEPKLNGVVLKVIKDANVRLSALRAGDIDMTEALPMVEVAKLVKTQDPKFTTQVYYFNSGARLVMNTKKAPFDKKEARQAVQYVLDRAAYNEAVYFGQGQVHNQPFVPDDVWYLDVPMVKTDLAKAKEAFTAAGLQQGTALTMLITPDQKDIGDVILAMLSQVGFTVKIETVDSAAWNDKGKKGEYDLLVGTMTGIFDPDRPYGYLRKESGSNWLCGFYDNPEMSKLLDEGLSTADVAKRKETYTKVLNMVQDEAAVIYVVGMPWVEAWQNTLKGYKPGTSPVLMMMDASDGLNTATLEK